MNPHMTALKVERTRMAVIWISSVSPPVRSKERSNTLLQSHLRPLPFVFEAATLAATAQRTGVRALSCRACRCAAGHNCVQSLSSAMDKTACMARPGKFLWPRTSSIREGRPHIARQVIRGELLITVHDPRSRILAEGRQGLGLEHPGVSGRSAPGVVHRLDEPSPGKGPRRDRC